MDICDEVYFEKIPDLPDGYEVVDGKLVNTKSKLGDEFVCENCMQPSILQIGCAIIIITNRSGRIKYGHICKKCTGKFDAIYEDGDSDADRD